MGTFVNLAGCRFDRVVVQAREPRAGGVYWRCLCDCGNTVVRLATNLTRGGSQSCGCVARERWQATITTHGLSKHPLHPIWKSMKQRCTDPSCTSYPRYGGRGITYDARWESFEAFYEDMLPGYAPGLSLERQDNDGPYSKANCRWAGRKAQGRNKSNNIRGEIDGVSYNLSEAVEEFGSVDYATAWARIKLGWTFVDAVMLAKGERP